MVANYLIESTAVLLGDCRISDSAYVGHLSVLGSAVLSRGFGELEWQPATARNHWRESRGLIIGPGVTVSEMCVIGDGTKIGARAFLDRRTTIGNDVDVAPDVEFYYGCEVSSRVTIGARAWIGGFVCNDVTIAEEAVVFGSLVHRFVDATRGVPELPPQIGFRAFVGMGAMVIGGVSVGEGAYIASGSVLTRDASPGRLYMGVPAKDMGVAPKAFRNPESRTLKSTASDLDGDRSS